MVLELGEEKQGRVFKLSDDERVKEVVKLLERPEQREIELNVGDNESGL